MVTSCGKSTDAYGIFRNDNDLCLGVVGERYYEYQNHELLELVINSAEPLGLSVTNGGVLKNGRKVFYQISLPETRIGNSGIKRYITALNSHNGSTSIGFGSSNTVVVCQNTFYRAYKETDKIRHCSTAKARLEIMSNNLKEIIQKDYNLMKSFEVMADTKLEENMVESVIKKIFSIDAKETSKEDISTRKKNNITIFANNLTTEIGIHGNTVWSLFNAVTRFTTHHASPTESNKKLDFLMAGTGQRMSNIAYNELMQYIDSNLLSEEDLITI